jgi:hypothetical protein
MNRNACSGEPRVTDTAATRQQNLDLIHVFPRRRTRNKRREAGCYAHAQEQNSLSLVAVARSVKAT